MSRRFYWLKMQNNFFNRLEIKRLRKMPNGSALVLIYVRLLLLSLKTDGILTFHRYEHDLAEELALDLDEEIDSVRAVLIYLQSHDLIREVEPNSYELAHVLEMTGSESESAERMRRYRDRRAAPSETPDPPQITETASPKAHTIARSDGQTSQCDIEKESEKESEGEKDLPPSTTEDGVAKEPDIQGQRFDEFWRQYPKKVGKKVARNAWNRIKPNIELYDRIMAAVEAAKKSEQWQRENKRFIPHPTTWLNQNRWEDELPEAGPSASKHGNTVATPAQIIAEEEDEPVELHGFHMAEK